VTVIATRCNAIGAPGYSETLLRHAASVSRARQLLITALDAWGLGRLADDGALVITELVTNAVQHSGRNSLRVSVTRPEPRRVRVAVSDKSPSVPSPRAPSDDEEAGRGLLIVGVVADRWGTDVRRWGKVVWAELVGGVEVAGE
jgi:anti-sigma regulatory factor (Ser/Thr protein kinase)